MSKLTFSVPWDGLCSKNAKFVGRFDKVLSPEYKLAQEKCGNLAFLAAKKQKWKRTEARVNVTVLVTEPTHHVRDVYNFGECILDALSKCAHDAIWWDDTQARRVTLEMKDDADREKAGAVITVEVR